MSHKSYNRPLEHKEYIKLKYLSQNDDKSKDIQKKIKKIKMIPNKLKKIRIFDDDIDLKNIESKESDDELYYGTKEEKPIIAQIFDERPLHMRREDIDTNRWKAIGLNGEEEDLRSEKTIKVNSKSVSSKKRKTNDSERSSFVRHNSRHIQKPSNSDFSPEMSTKDVAKDKDALKHELPISSSNSRRHDSDSDLSPERLNKESYRCRDLSPPRHGLSKSDYNHRRHDSDSDLSPPRVIKTVNTSTESPKKELTLGGKKAGLSEAKHLRQELMATKRKEQKMFESISDEMLGKNAKTVFRDSKSGKIRDLEEEAALQYQKDLVKDTIDSQKKAKYEKWSKGVVQTQQQKDRLESDLHEMSKPLARYEGDIDLDQMLREKEREDDPMLQTMRKNKTKQQIQEEGIIVRPEYKGPPPPMNRFGIKPGFRWDGVDRSNGFEKKYFERISNKESTLEEAYRWSTQDM